MRRCCHSACAANVVLRYPLHSAAAAGRDDAVMDLLLARGGCARYVANALDGDGLTALHRAAAAGKLCISSRVISHAVAQCCYMARDAEIVLNSGKATCVAALLDSGAVQQVQTPLNPTAVTPMLLAAAFGREECVRLLASHNPAGSTFEIVEFLRITCNSVC